MDNMKCCVARDLLPLYIDDVLSEETAALLQDHLEACEDCRREYRTLLKDVVMPTCQEVQEENSRVLKVFKSKWTVKKIFISVLSAFLGIALFFPIRNAVMESEWFSPTTWARAGTVGQLYLGDLSNGEWTRLSFIKKNPFNNSTNYCEPYLIFDNPFYEKRAINSANSATSVEMRVLDKEGNVILGPFTAEPGDPVSLSVLASGVEYMVEWKGDGDFYMFAFE